jgi:hypothetical protein
MTDVVFDVRSTMSGLGAFSSGNQSGGPERFSISARVYALVLPGIRTGPDSSTAGG